MIEVHLFGELRRYGPTQDPTVECVVLAERRPDLLTIGDLVASLGIHRSEVVNVFQDGLWQREGLEASLGNATRLGLFPPRMNMLYV